MIGWIILIVILIGGGIAGFFVLKKLDNKKKTKEANELLIKSSKEGNIEDFKKAIDDGAKFDHIDTTTGSTSLMFIILFLNVKFEYFLTKFFS